MKIEQLIASTANLHVKAFVTDLLGLVEQSRDLHKEHPTCPPIEHHSNYGYIDRGPYVDRSPSYSDFGGNPKYWDYSDYKYEERYGDYKYEG